MTKRHPAGIFEAVLENEEQVPAYRLRVTTPGGHVTEIDDPYRFGRILSDFDSTCSARAITPGSTTSSARIRSTSAAPWASTSPSGPPTLLRVSVVGDFNGWDGRVHPMRSLGASGVWEIFIPAAQLGQRYKFELRTRSGDVLLKIDPFGSAFEVPPLSASIVCRPEHDWQDARVDGRRDPPMDCWFERPMAVYEVHLGSWARVPDEEHRYLTYARARRAADPVREGDGLHAHRAPAGDGAPVLRILGLSGHRLLRARPAASGRRPTSRPSSTPAIAPASA